MYQLKNYFLTSLHEIFVRPKNHLKFLDGLRALAIIAVICMHVNEFFLRTNNHSSGILSSLPLFRGGWVGVPLFFVLSGFLIGGQLWKELSIKKNIAFWRFVFRRGFRIWPLYYFIILVSVFFNLALSYDSTGLFSNVFFLGNYLSDNGPIFGSWSLATEEQFYILAPLILILLANFFPDKKMSFYRKILSGIFIMPLIARIITWNYVLEMNVFDLNIYMKYIYRPFHTNSEGLIAGMIISNYYYDKDSFFYREFRNIKALLVLSVAVFILSFFSKVYLNFTGVALGFSFLLIYLLKSPNDILNKFFSHNLFYVISKTSFATYLIHVYVIKKFLTIEMIKKFSFGIEHLELVSAFFIVLIVCVFIGSLLYLFVEKPFMLIREKIYRN